MKPSPGMFMNMDLQPFVQRVDVWLRAAPVAAFPSDRGVCIRLGTRRIALYHDSGTERWYAFDDLCPQCGKPALAETDLTFVEGRPQITCSEDRTSFFVDGVAGGETSVESIPVIVDDDHVFIGLRYATPEDRP